MDKLLYHLRFSFRVFLKDKFFSALNVVGLAMGIAVGIILMLILKNDLTYDQHYAKHKNIYRLGAHYVIPGVDHMTGLSARELTPILKDHYPRNPGDCTREQARPGTCAGKEGRQNLL